MKRLSIKHYLGSAFVLATLVATPILLKATNAMAFPGRLAEELSLTAEQQSELEAIKEDARTQVESVLTTEQQATLDGQTGRDRRQAMRNLDLSDEQRSQLQTIRENSRAAADEVLTDEQQAQLQELRADRVAQRENRREEFAERLNITPEQQAELDTIQENARIQIEAVLTEDQQASLEGKTGRERMQALRALDLSDEQRASLQEIREDTRAAADDVLTEEQQAQLQEMRGNRRH